MANTINNIGNIYLDLKDYDLALEFYNRSLDIYKELEADLGIAPAEHGFLESWAKQGILMLNTVLTVRAHQANSHRKKGWEKFTDAVIREVNEQCDSVVFLLWGKPAQKKTALIDEERHTIVASAHPSPLSARSWPTGSARTRASSWSRRARPDTRTAGTTHERPLPPVVP